MTKLQAINEFEKNDSWANCNYQLIKEKYKDEFIAIKDGDVVAEANTIQAVMKILKEKKINLSKTLIEFVHENRILIL